MATTINAQPGSALLPTAIVKTADSTGNLAFQTSGVTALTINTLQNITANSAGAFGIPVGNTAQRPASPVNGMIRYNSDNFNLEGYIGNTWINITADLTYTASYLIVAGGGGGWWITGLWSWFRWSTRACRLSIRPW